MYIQDFFSTELGKSHEEEEAPLVRQRSLSCPDITKDHSVNIEENLLDTEITNYRPKIVGKLDKSIFSNAIKSQSTETNSKDVIFWALEYLDQLFVLLAKTNDDNVREQKSESSMLLYTISEESVHSISQSDERLNTSSPNPSPETPENEENLFKKSNKKCNLEPEVPIKRSDTDKIQLENNLSTIVDDENVLEEMEPRSKVENIVLYNLHAVIRGTIRIKHRC